MELKGGRWKIWQSVEGTPPEISNWKKDENASLNKSNNTSHDKFWQHLVLKSPDSFAYYQ